MFDKTKLIEKRLDGSFVVTVNELPYQVIADDPLYSECVLWWEEADEGLKVMEQPPPPPIPMSFEEAFRMIRYVSGRKIDEREDQFAQSLEYDNFNNMLKRALSTDPIFKYHAEVAADYDAQLWAALRDTIQPMLLQKIQAGELSVPSWMHEVDAWVVRHVVPYLPPSPILNATPTGD